MRWSLLIALGILILVPRFGAFLLVVLVLAALAGGSNGSDSSERSKRSPSSSGPKIRRKEVGGSIKNARTGETVGRWRGGRISIEEDE